MITRPLYCTWLLAQALIAILSKLAEAAIEAKPDKKASYAPGQAIPISCLNRTMWVLFLGS